MVDKKKTFLKGGPRHKVCIFSKNALQKKSFLKQKMQTKKAFFCKAFFEKTQGLHFLFQNGFFFLKRYNLYIFCFKKEGPRHIFFEKIHFLCRGPPFRKRMDRSIFVSISYPLFVYILMLTIGLEPITAKEQILSLSCLPISPSEPG